MAEVLTASLLLKRSSHGGPGLRKDAVGPLRVPSAVTVASAAYIAATAGWSDLDARLAAE